MFRVDFLKKKKHSTWLEYILHHLLGILFDFLLTKTSTFVRGSFLKLVVLHNKQTPHQFIITKRDKEKSSNAKFCIFGLWHVNPFTVVTWQVLVVSVVCLFVSFFHGQGFKVSTWYTWHPLSAIARFRHMLTNRKRASCRTRTTVCLSSPALSVICRGLWLKVAWHWGFMQSNSEKNRLKSTHITLTATEVLSSFEAELSNA